MGFEGVEMAEPSLTAHFNPLSAEKPTFFSAFPTEGPKLPTEPPRWTSGLPFPIPPREVIKTSPHAADPSAFSYTPPGEWAALQLGLCRQWKASSLHWRRALWCPLSQMRP